MVGLIVFQAAVGYTQYFTGVPPTLVGLHVLGATLVWVAVLHLVLRFRRPVDARPVDRAEPAASDTGPVGPLVGAR